MNTENDSLLTAYILFIAFFMFTLILLGLVDYITSEITNNNAECFDLQGHKINEVNCTVKCGIIGKTFHKNYCYGGK